MGDNINKSNEITIMKQIGVYPLGEGVMTEEAMEGVLGYGQCFCLLT